jgi:hypothetical protein
MQREEVAGILRKDFLVTEERADKLSGSGKHPLLGRMYLPAYWAGAEVVAQLRRLHPPDQILPAIYGCSGLVDIVTIDEVSKCCRWHSCKTSHGSEMIRTLQTSEPLAALPAHPRFLTR